MIDLSCFIARQSTAAVAVVGAARQESSGDLRDGHLPNGVASETIAYARVHVRGAHARAHDCGCDDHVLHGDLRDCCDAHGCCCDHDERVRSGHPSSGVPCSSEERAAFGLPTSHHSGLLEMG